MPYYDILKVPHFVFTSPTIGLHAYKVKKHLNFLKFAASPPQTGITDDSFHAVQNHFFLLVSCCIFFFFFFCISRWSRVGWGPINSADPCFQGILMHENKGLPKKKKKNYFTFWWFYTQSLNLVNSHFICCLIILYCRFTRWTILSNKLLIFPWQFEAMSLEEL